MTNDIITVNENVIAQPTNPSGEGIVALIQALDASATILKNVVTSYFDSSASDTDHGSGSKISVGVLTVRANGGQAPVAVAAGKLASSPFTETFGTGTAISTGTLNTARLPIRKGDITSVARDGTSILAGLAFTNKDPTTLTPTSGQIIINPKTGVWKTGTATSGSGAGVVIVYDAYDWATAWKTLLANAVFTTITIPGSVFGADDWGVWDYIAAQAFANQIEVVGATTAGTDPSSTGLQATNFDVTSSRYKNAMFFAAPSGSTGDLSSAWATAVAAQAANATFLEQLAPTGNVTYAGNWTDAQLGSPLDSTSGTFYDIGINAVYRDRSGAYYSAASRAAQATSSSWRNGATQRSLDAVYRVADSALRALRRSTPTSIAYTDAGLASVKDVLASALQARLVARGIINAGPAIVIPPRASQAAGDITAGIVRGITLNVGLPGQVEAFAVQINASLT